MKMVASLCTLLLWVASTDGLRFMSDKKNESAPADPNPETPPLDGPAHKDNFQDEIVDQADPEFGLLSGGDGCVSWDEFKNTLEQQFQEGAPDMSGMSAEEKKEMDEIKKQMTENLKMQWEHSDTNKDNCVDKAEFEAAGEMEGPPPGFQQKKEEEIGEEALTKEMIAEDRLEFDAMDRGGDGKVSRTEAYNYASENMPSADVNDEDLDEMFNMADTNGDGFITFDEFEGAGQEIDGDGNEMEDATPINFFGYRRKMASVRAKVTKTMLAHKPPLKVMSRLWNRKM